MTDKWTEKLAESCLGYLDQGISVVDPDLNFVFANNRFYELLQLPESLLKPGTSLADVFRYNAKRGEYGEGDVEEQVRFRMELARKRESHSFERIRPDGIVLQIDGTPTPEGGFVTTYSDITELYNSRLALQKTNEELDDRVQRRTVELAAREAELLEKTTALETIMASVGTGLALFDKDLNLVTSNQQFIKTLEYPVKFKRQGTSIEEFFRFGAVRGDYGDGPIEKTVDKLMRATRKFRPYRKIIKYRDGRYIEHYGKPTADGMVASYVDITEQKQAEEFLKRNTEILEEKVEERTAELRAAKELAENASRSKSQFLANMSHELRTPLNAIIGFSELLMMNDYTVVDMDKRVEYSGDINSAGIHLLQVINDILDVAKIEANQINLAEKDLEIRSLVDSCLHMLSVPAKNRDITMSIDIPDNIPLMNGDPTRIKQIIANLLSNAVKFTDSGGTICTRVQLLEDQSLSISVIDDGIGISKDDMEHVLTQFGQVQSSYNRNHQGTGLGLSLVLLLTEAHGGHFYLDSKLGEGTTAHVVFPPSRTRMLAG